MIFLALESFWFCVFLLILLYDFVVFMSFMFDKHEKTGLWGFRPGPTQTDL